MSEVAVSQALPNGTADGRSTGQGTNTIASPGDAKFPASSRQHASAECADDSGTQQFADMDNADLDGDLQWDGMHEEPKHVHEAALPASPQGHLNSQDFQTEPQQSDLEDHTALEHKPQQCAQEPVHLGLKPQQEDTTDIRQQQLDQHTEDLSMQEGGSSQLQAQGNSQQDPYQATSTDHHHQQQQGEEYMPNSSAQEHQQHQQPPEQQDSQRHQKQGSRSGREQKQDNQQQNQQQAPRSVRQPIPAPPRMPVPAADSKPERLTSPRDDSTRPAGRVPFVNRRDSADCGRPPPSSRSAGSSRPTERSSDHDARPGAGRPAGRHPSPGRDRDRERGRERERRDGRDADRESERPAADRGRPQDVRIYGSTRDSHHREQPQQWERSAARDGRDIKDRVRSSGSGREVDRERERERERNRERQPERNREREPEREREWERARKDERIKDRVRDSSRRASPDRQQQRHDSAVNRAKAPSTEAATAAAGPGPFQVVDKFLAKQSTVEEVLLPTPTNVNTIHVPGDELLNFIRVQQWVEDKCKSPLPLLNGAFVLVSSCDIPELCSKEVQAACGYGRSSSRAFVRTVSKHIPWRLRQIETVEVGADSEPGQALLLLEGGGCVKASMVSCDGLGDVQDYEYLCCELSELQASKALKGLRVYDIAHVAWRMRVGTELEAAIEKFDKDQAELREHGYDAEMMEDAARASLDEVSIAMKKLPPLNWVDGQIMQYVELNPFARPEFPEESRDPLNKDQVASLTRFATDAWSSYVKCKLEGKEPPLVSEYVPWKALPRNEDVEMQPTVDPAAAAAAAGQYGAAAGYQQPFGTQPGVQYMPQQQQQQQQQQVLAAPGNGYGALPGALPAVQQQRSTGLLLDVDDFADDFGFYDDPLAPLDANPLLSDGSVLGAPAAGSGGTAGALPKGMLGVGMSLDHGLLGSGLLQHGSATASTYGLGSTTTVGAGAAGAPEGPRGADYSYWVERGNQAAAATDPRRTRAAAGRGNAPGVADAGLTGALGPMWGGQKPPPGMADAGLASNRQQQQQRESDSQGARRSVLERINGPGDSRGRDADRRGSDRSRHDPSSFSIDMRPRGGQAYSSRSPPRRSSDGRRPSRSGSRGRGRSRSPAGARVVDRLGDRRAVGGSPGRGGPHGGDGSGGRSRGLSPDPKGRDSSKQARSISPGKEKHSMHHRDPRDSSPSSSKRKRDADGGRDAGRQRAATPDESKRRRREGEGEGAGRESRGGDGSSRRGRGADADVAGSPLSGRQPASSPAGDIQAVARRFGGRLEGADSIFADIQLERDVKAWLQQLARYAGNVPRRLEQPVPMNLRTLVKQLPLPQNILHSYQNMTSFVQKRPELAFSGSGQIILLAQHHADLLAAPRSAAPSPQQGRSAAAAAAQADSDPEDYLAGHKSGKQRGSSRLEKVEDAGRERVRDRERDRDRGKEKEAAGSAGRSSKGEKGNSSSRKEQQPGWQEDRQPYLSGSRERDSATAAAAGSGGGGPDRGRKASASSPPRPAAGSGAPFPGALRVQDARPDSGRGSGRGRGGQGGPEPAAPVIRAHVADMVIREFRDKLAEALRTSATGFVSQTRGYDLLPLPLADRVKPDGKMNLQKLLKDYYPEFELRRDQPGGPFVIVRHPNPNRPFSSARPCRFWNPITLAGCVKGQGCDFKHELVPSAAHFAA